MPGHELYRVNSPAVINETIEGESVIINLNTGIYYSLDPIGSEIWDGIAGGLSVPDIVSSLENRYAGGDIGNAVDQLFAELSKEGLIVPSNGPTGAVPAKGPAPAPAKAAFTKPKLSRFGDMQDLLLLDPIHDVDQEGWPHSPGEDPQPK